MNDEEANCLAEQSLSTSVHDGCSIRVLVVHRLRLLSEMFVRALNADNRFEAFRSLEKIEFLYADLKQQTPDVVLVNSDWGDSGLSAEDAIRLCHSTLPRVRTVLYLDSEDEDGPVLDAFRAGARGVISKDDSVDALKRCLQLVSEGQIWARNDHLHQVLLGLEREESLLDRKESGGGVGLTKRERDIVRCVADGLSNRDIALRLDLSVHTVKNYLFRLYERLDVTNRAELVAFALNHQSTVNNNSSGSPTQLDA